jgi:DNA polymerase III delta prime subunit
LAVHPDFSEFSAEAEASAESVREFTIRMGMKPFVAKLKFALMTNIENLTSQGANALLKTLEEPPENTVMVLTANLRKVLPTIFSRCQVFNFNRRGSHADANADHTPEVKISDYAGKSLAEKLLAVNTFSDLEESDLKQRIEDFINHCAQRLSAEPQKYVQLAAGLKAYEDLDTNKNRKLILQGLMVKI